MNLLVRMLLATASVVAVVAWTPLSVQEESASEPPRSVQDGVFSEKQAQRGATLFEMNCLACHQPAEFADGYLDGWSGQTVGDLFEFVRTSMPEDSPGRLKRSEYADILAYIFSMNDFPAGDADLKSDYDTLSKVVIKNAAGSN